MKTILTKIYRFAHYPNRLARLLRLANLLEIRLQREYLLTHPPVLCLDPGPVCNLRCLSCPTGDGTSRLEREFLLPEVFEKIVSNIRVNRLAHVNLYRLGEPLLNRHLNPYIEYFTKRKIFTALSANFSAKDYDEAYLEALARTGLDEITVCVDGMSQETYEKYRVGGNLARVLGNLRRLSSVKKAHGLKKPRLIFKMLLNKFNQHEVEEAKRMAAELDAEFYQPHFFWTPAGQDEEWMADAFKEKYQGTPQTYIVTKGDAHRDVDTECRQLWDTAQVNANGDVFPCCFCVDPAAAVGNLTRQHIDEIWNNERMRAMRRYVTYPDTEPLTFPNRCNGCPHRFCTYWAK